MLRTARASMMLLVLLGCGTAANAQNRSAKLAFFENQIRPLLSKHCYECHNEKKQEGGLRLDFRQAMLDGGESGTVIVPGKPEQSVLIEAVQYEGFEMPPDGKLSDDDIAKLVRWVREGALWPESDTVAKPSLGDQEAIRKTADSHWAFAMIESPDLPETSDPDWAKHPIDRFILAKLETNGLKPSPAARRPTLIRRAFNDLIGLPPTPEIIESVLVRQVFAERHSKKSSNDCWKVNTMASAWHAIGWTSHVTPTREIFLPPQICAIPSHSLIAIG